MLKRLTTEKGQISIEGCKYMERMKNLIEPVFQEMVDEGYDMADIRMIRDELMRYELVKMMVRRKV